MLAGSIRSISLSTMSASEAWIYQLRTPQAFTEHRMLALHCEPLALADTTVPGRTILLTGQPSSPFFMADKMPFLQIGERRRPYFPVPVLKDGTRPAGSLAHDPDSKIEMTTRDQSADKTEERDDDAIIERGRGPELRGTRITVYRIMDFLRYGYSASEIAEELGLTARKVSVAIEYIRSHQEQSDREYELILERVNQPNPPEVDRGRAKTREELRQRIRARLERTSAHDHPLGQ